MTLLTPAECPVLLYPSSAAERLTWLRERDWRCDLHDAADTERWRHPDLLGMTFSRTGACRVQSGISTPEREAQ
jgi:hypothetical protein